MAEALDRCAYTLLLLRHDLKRQRAFLGFGHAVCLLLLSVGSGGVNNLRHPLIFFPAQSRILPDLFVDPFPFFRSFIMRFTA